MIEYYVIAVSIILVLSLAIVIFSKTSSNKILEEQNKRQEIELNHRTELLQNSFHVQENERQRISHELHDEIGNKLNVISLMIRNNSAIPSDSEKEVLDLLNNTIEKARIIAHELYPPMLERMGLRLTLSEHLEPLKSQLNVFFSCDFDESRLDKASNLQILRIAQEFISNSIKHSKATELTLQIRESNHKIYIRLSDNGIGFDLKEASGKGMGIQNFESRVESMNGVLKFKAAINKGVTLLIQIES